jgi:hypothetical protein
MLERVGPSPVEEYDEANTGTAPISAIKVSTDVGVSWTWRANDGRDSNGAVLLGLSPFP